MKKLGLILLCSILFSGLTLAQKNNTPNAEFKKTEYDFGSIKEEVEKATCEFVFSNTGKVPLIINQVRTSCGCTTPSYTREPILPGKKGRINVAYSTIRRPGNFNKQITVYTNAPDTVYILRIKGSVIPKKQ